MAQASLALENLAIAVRLASLPEAVRGFGHVKDAAIAGMEQQRAQLMKQIPTRIPTQCQAPRPGRR